jgi:Xaa-Pro aminopeptidase
MLFSRPPIRPSWLFFFRQLRQPPLHTRFFSASVRRYAVDMATVNTTERLSKLRQLMQDHKVDVYSMTSSASFIVDLL